MKIHGLIFALIGTVTAASTPVAASSSVTAANLFEQNCEICHQAEGVGVPGQFPRLSGRTARIAANPDGRRLLTDVLLYGMSGTITVDDRQIVGVMPSFARLPDDQIASLLNYLVALKPEAKAKRYTPAEIAVARKGPVKQSNDLAKENSRLALAGVAK